MSTGPETPEPSTPEHDGYASEIVLEGGNANAGSVVRVGDTVRRPRGSGHELEEAVLQHLEHVGFAYAPRLLGIDSSNRQILTFIEGDVAPMPSWQLDDAANATALGELAAVARQVHDALSTFVPPPGATPMRPIPGPGVTWNHADLGYHNTVYFDGRIAGLIDWEYVAQGDALYDIASLVGMSTRTPRPDRDETEARIVATRLAYHAIADGYGASDEQRNRLRFATSAMLADTADFLRSKHPDTASIVAWKSEWFAEHGHVLLG